MVPQPKKLQTAVLVMRLSSCIAAIMPEQWFGRMDSIGEYKDDDSALGRLNAWQFAFNVASSNLMGGGFNSSRRECSKCMRPIRGLPRRRTAFISR